LNVEKGNKSEHNRVVVVTLKLIGEASCSANVLVHGVAETTLETPKGGEFGDVYIKKIENLF